MWHSWALWPGALLNSVQAVCDKRVPPASLDTLSLPGTLTACCPLVGALSCARSRGHGSRRVGATHGAALPWLPPAMKRAQALQRIWDVPSGAAQRSGLQGGCGPSPSVWLVRGRGAFPHIAFTMDYIRCGDVNGAGTAVTSVHLSILPSIHPSAHPPAHPLFLHSFSNSPFLSLSLSLFISLSLFVSLSLSPSLSSPWVLGFPCWHRRWKRTP